MASIFDKVYQTVSNLKKKAQTGISNVKGNVQAIANPQTRGTWFQGFTPVIQQPINRVAVKLAGPQFSNWTQDLISDTKRRGLFQGTQDLFNPILMNKNIYPITEPIVSGLRVGKYKLQQGVKSIPKTAYKAFTNPYINPLYASYQNTQGKINVPQINVAQRIKNPVLRTAGQLGEGILNMPYYFIGSAGKMNKGIVESARDIYKTTQGQRVAPQSWVRNVANVTDLPVNIALMGRGAKNVLTSNTLKRKMIGGAQGGWGYGFPTGVLESLQNIKDTDDFSTVVKKAVVEGTQRGITMAAIGTLFGLGSFGWDRIRGKPIIPDYLNGKTMVEANQIINKINSLDAEIYRPAFQRILQGNKAYYDQQGNINMKLFEKDIELTNELYKDIYGKVGKKISDEQKARQVWSAMSKAFREGRTWQEAQANIKIPEKPIKGGGVEGGVSKEIGYHSTDTTIKGNVIKAGQPSSQNYFGEGVYLGSHEGVYPGQNTYKAQIPEGLKTLDLTKGNSADTFLSKVSKETGVPIEKTGMGVYEDLRMMASKSSDKTIRQAVDKITSGYEAIKSPLEYEGQYEMVIRKPEIPKVVEGGVKEGGVGGVKTTVQGSTPLPKNIQAQIQQSLSSGQKIAPTSLKGGKTPQSVVEQGQAPPQFGGPSGKIIPQKKYAYNINLERLNLKPEEKANIKKTIDIATPELQKFKGKILSNEEVVKAAKTSEILQKTTTRDATLQAEAALLKARQQMVSLDKEVTQLTKSGNTPQLRAKLTDLVETLKVVSSNAADRGRQLQALSISAEDQSLRQQVLKEILKTQADSQKVIDGAMKVNWNNANEVSKFYRSFVKPSVGQIIDEYRYNNMLSNPRTHLRNAFSNLVQTFLTRPTTIALQGDIKGVAQYYTGALKNFPEAVDAFVKSFKGETPIVKPDLQYISTHKLPRFMTIPTRAMEAADRFFSALIRGGEVARGATEQQALKTAEYSLFRGGLKPEGQGKLLNAIDSATGWMYKAPKAIRWFAPFIRTPMNFAKQWIEYSPAGLATLPGATNRKEQLAKTILGSIVTAIGAGIALDGRTTWSAPTDPKQKEQFYATGRKPFSVLIGGKWVSMQYLGPFGLAMAMPAAVKYYNDESRTSPTDDMLTKIGRSLMGMAEYFSGQTFLEGINNFVKLASGDVDYTLPKNLGYATGQIIPLEGLVRYVTTIIDPIYRKPKGYLQQLQSNIPGLSKQLPMYTTPKGEPSTRERFNLMTPYDITTNKPEYEEKYDERTLKLQQNNAKKRAIEVFLEGDRETARQLQQQTQFKVKASEIKSAAKKKAIEAFLQGDRETARRLQQQYKFKVTKKDIYGE